MDQRTKRLTVDEQEFLPVGVDLNGRSVIIAVRCMARKSTGLGSAWAQECGDARVRAGACGMNAKFEEPECVALELKEAGNSELEDRNHFDVLCLLDEPNEKLFAGM
jgi:hypothetical protein